MLQFFDNKAYKVGDDLKGTIKKNSKLQIAAGLFSIYGFQVLKDELKQIDSLKFIFTDPTFVETDKKKREQRQFQLNPSSIQKSISGTEFEINLKNELKGKGIAKECKKWIEQKVQFKTNICNKTIQPHTIVINEESNTVYTDISEFSSAGFGYEKDNYVIRNILKTDEAGLTKSFLDGFNEIWNDKKLLKDITGEVTEYVSNLYKENAPEYIYYLTLYNIFNEFLEDISDDELANEKTGFKNSAVWNKLYDFQKDAVLGIINRLERHNGCILADSVGLGKTFSALAVIKYYQERNRTILVLCPKKLGDNWLTFLNNYEENPLLKDRFNYDVLYHTDLLREKGESNGVNLARVNWGNYDLVVIDESHNFRNNNPSKTKITRYQKLLNEVMRKGVKTKVLMLSATPVNNRFNDLKNQLALAWEGETGIVEEALGTERTVDSILANAQKTFNDWSKLPVDDRNSKELFSKLNNNFDFFKLLDGVTIARSRRHIEKFYDIEKIGKFPNRLKPITQQSDITDISGFIEIKDIYDELTKLTLAVYSPTEFILSSRRDYYSKLYDTNISKNVSFKQSHREKSLQKLMRVNLLKRLESSVDSFRITLEKFIMGNQEIIESIKNFERTGKSDDVTERDILTDIDFDNDDWREDDFTVGKIVKIKLEDMNTSGWKDELEYDVAIASALLEEMKRIKPEKDKKLQDLKKMIKKKVENPINPGNRKILIFSAFADTVDYLYQNLADYFKTELSLETAKITGSDKNKCTLKIDTKFESILTNFSPRSKERRNKNAPEIDILIATDCISEGQNLQDCDTLINYDIHWNPVRIIQRFGRIDRIGSINKDIQLVNFWPQLSLDDYINLKSRIESKMYMVDATATGEDNVLTNESSDLAFRKKQLEKLQKEVVDIEEMNSGISITDLGLNDFRMDLVNFVKENGSLETAPNGMHTVCNRDSNREIDEGVIFVLKNINRSLNIDKTNLLHPFYMVYIKQDGSIISNHLSVKKSLDILRSLCKGRNEPIKEVYEIFNDETDDGKKMDVYSNLLNSAIKSIVNVNEQRDIESLFSPGGTTALFNSIKGLEDFELLTFIVIK